MKVTFFQNTIFAPYNVGSVLRRLFSTAEYWTASAVILMLSLHSIDAIPHSTDAILPQYWCYPPAVLNSLRSTEQPPQYWTDVIRDVGSTEGPSKVFLLFLLLSDWLKLNYLKSRMECGVSDIFSFHICSTVAAFEAAEMILGPWNQQYNSNSVFWNSHREIRIHRSIYITFFINFIYNTKCAFVFVIFVTWT